MSLPVGVTTRTMSIGREFDGNGNTATLHLSVLPDFGTGVDRILWTATGETWAAKPFTPPLQSDPDGDPTETFALPIVDEAGWEDMAGNAITNWHYAVTVTVTFTDTVNGVATKTKMKPYTKFVSPKSTDSSPIDMDKLPYGAAASPTLAPGLNVTSVAGVPGAVVSAADLVAALAASGLIAPVVTHGTSTSVARPAGASVVIWYGTADPAARQPQDIWTDAT